MSYKKQTCLLVHGLLTIRPGTWIMKINRFRHSALFPKCKSNIHTAAFWNIVWDRCDVLLKHGTVSLLDVPQDFLLIICIFCFRLIGSANVSLKDLASSQVKSLPVKNLALVDENGKSIGVSFFSSFLLTHKKYIYLIYIVIFETYVVISRYTCNLHSHNSFTRNSNLLHALSLKAFSSL